MDTDVIADYCRKSGDDSIPSGHIEQDQHGFCVWRIEDSALILVAVYGDGSYWNEWATKKAMNENIKTIIFATKRKPDAFIRKHGFKVTGYILARSV